MFDVYFLNPFIDIIVTLKYYMVFYYLPVSSENIQLTTRKEYLHTRWSHNPFTKKTNQNKLKYKINEHRQSSSDSNNYSCNLYYNQKYCLIISNCRWLKENETNRSKTLHGFDVGSFINHMFNFLLAFSIFPQDRATTTIYYGAHICPVDISRRPLRSVYFEHKTHEKREKLKDHNEFPAVGFLYIRSMVIIIVMEWYYRLYLKKKKKNFYR